MIEPAEVELTVNGVSHRASVEPRKTLVDHLREDCLTTGVHVGCEHGSCGACTVLLDGLAVRSCLLFAVQVNGSEITTAEGLVNTDGTLGVVQEAFRDCHGLQCGFCTPGFIVSVSAILADNPELELDEIRHALSGNLCRCTGYQGIIAAVLQAAEAMASVTPDTSLVTDTAGATPDGSARFVGQSVKRLEDPRLVSGHGRFVDDVVLPGMLHAAFLRSDLARGRIAPIDTSSAANGVGVRAVVTADDLNHRVDSLRGSIFEPDRAIVPTHVLAPGDVRFVGDPIAMVVADNRYLAEDALELIDIAYEPLPPVVDFETAAESQYLVHPELDSNLGATLSDIDPTLDEVFESAAVLVIETFHQHRQSNMPMETRGIVVHWQPFADQLDVWASTQSPHELTITAARVLGLGEHQVRVHMGDVGGAFGQKVFVGREEAAVLLLAKDLGRPVKWIEDRRENLIAANSARVDRLTVQDGGRCRRTDPRCRDRSLERQRGLSAWRSPAQWGRAGVDLPGPVSDPQVQLDHVHRVHQHPRAGCLSRPVADGDSRARADDGPRRGTNRSRSHRIPTAQRHPPGRAPVHHLDRTRLREHLARGDPRASPLDARLRGVPGRAGGRPRRRPVPGGRARTLRRSRRPWAEGLSDPRVRS